MSEVRAQVVTLMRAPPVISTFAGCGGSSLGFRDAGFEELAAIEWDRNAAECLALNFSKLKVMHGDIKQITARRLLTECGLARGELDVLDGSPPCQGFSTSGSRDPGDLRNQLFREFARILRGLAPKAFVMENVSGMIKGPMKGIFVMIMRELRACGYKVHAELMDAAHFGVPQRRLRVIYIGIREDMDIEPSHPIPTSRPVAVGEAIADFGDMQDADRLHVWIDESPSGRNTKTWSLAHRARQGQKYAGQHYRDRWDRPAGTMTTGGLANMPPYLRSLNCHPLYTRTYSVAEMKRLFSFPDEFKFAGQWHMAVKRMGNSVPPKLMRAVAAHARKLIG